MHASPDPNPFGVDGYVVIVTGGASGIGEATARLFSKAGASVAIFDVDLQSARTVVKELDEKGGTAVAHRVDVADEIAVEAAIDAVVGKFGRIDVLVNNAGIAIREPAIELSLEKWNKVVAVNQTGTFLCARHAARHMLRQKSGRIINVASIMGLSGGGLYPNISYQTTKGAVVNMTRALAIEWADHNILVNAIAPTYANTPLVQGLMKQPGIEDRIRQLTPLGRLAEPEEIASAILFLAGPGASMITGHVLAVDGGFLAQ